MDKDKINDIWEYWFLDLDEDSEVTFDSAFHRRWFTRDLDLDKEIKKMYGADVKNAAKGEYDDWINDPQGRLVLIILLDQFSRRIHRDSPKAYANDLKALELSLMSVKDGFDGRVGFVERIFYFLPIMHAENLELQETSLQAFQKLVREAERYEDLNVEYCKYMMSVAVKYAEAMKQFSRFPHRNDLLNRRSTSDERLYLSDEKMLINEFI